MFCRTSFFWTININLFFRIWILKIFPQLITRGKCYLFFQSSNVDQTQICTDCTSWIHVPGICLGWKKNKFLSSGMIHDTRISAFVTSDISKSAYVILSEIEFQAYWLIWADIHLKLGGITGILSRYFSGLWTRPFTYSREIMHILRGFQDSRQ